MYALWRGSSVGSQGYPAHLALWSDGGTLLDELALDSLDVTPSLLSTMVRDLPAGDTVRVTQALRVPGVHYILLVRYPGGDVMTTVIGPRSALVQPGRVGRLLDPGSQQTPLYRLTLGPPADPATPTPSPRWHRAGRSVRNAYVLDLPGGRRTLHAPLAQPGALLPHPAGRDAGSVLPAAYARFRGVELCPARARGAAEPRPVDHPDPARRGAHRRWPHSRGQPGARRAPAGAQSPDRRGPRALRRGTTRRHQHPGAGGSGRDAAAHGSRRLRHPGAEWRPRGDPGRLHSFPGGAGRLPGHSARRANRHRGPGHAPAG